jgi:hypothetical protein
VETNSPDIFKKFLRIADFQDKEKIKAKGRRRVK